jgi:hypothetical protein
MTANAPDPVSQIPPAVEVQARLAANLRENRLLKSLLRLSQQVEAARERTATDVLEARSCK